MMHELLRTYNISGILQNMSGAVEQSARTFESTNQLAEKARIEHPDDMRIVREMALANDGLASMDVLHGLPLIAATRAGLAIDAMEMSFDYGGLTHAQTTLAEAMNQMGDHTLALETSARAVRSSLGLQWNNLAASAQVVFAHTNILLGNLDAGWQALEKTFEICETNHLVEEKACFHLIRGKVFRLFEDFEKAIDEFKTAMALKCSPYTTAETLLNYGMSLQLANRPEEGALMVKEAFDMALRYEFVALRLTIENIKAADKGAQGDFDGACKLLQDLAELSNQRGLKQIAAAIYFNYGSFMLAKGNFFVARRLVQSLVNPETAQGPWTVMRGLVLMDRINRREGLDDDTPRQRLVEVFEHLRSSTHVEPFKTQVAHFSRNILRQVDDG